MAKIEVKNLSFSYPLAKQNGLVDISFQIEEGDFVLILGKSGSGKTTLLKNLKKEIIPHGTRTGEVIYQGKDILEQDTSLSIGFVMQNTESQIVCDKVWHELAFGLENLALNQKTMHAKVAETCYFFDLQNLYERDVHTLSGGEKQLMNIASIMVTKPDVLILDEPFSKLDVTAKEELLKYLKKLNDELGTTIIIAEHRLEEVMPYCNKIMMMEDGKVSLFDETKQVLHQMTCQEKYDPMLPHTLKISKGKPGKEIFMTVKEARNYLKTISIPSCTSINIDNIEHETVLEGKELYFRYDRKEKDILNNLSFKTNRGEIYSVVAGNGSGKTTLLSVICGILKPYFGKIVAKEKIAMLPQNPKTLLLHQTVEEELTSVSSNHDEIFSLAQRFGLTTLMKKHPYDLSGGEEEKVALAKVLLTGCKILLLDEPTKGIDGYFKKELILLLKELKDKGYSIIIVSHDMEFCAEVSDRCSMLFQGNLVGENKKEEFFLENSFYTNDIVRMTAGIAIGIVTYEQLESVLKEGNDVK